MFANDMLKDQVVLVTGGGSGIGFSIAKTCLDLGAKVVIASRTEEKLQKATEELSQYGECSYQVCDIRSLESIEALADAIEQRHGKLDILMNNAGGQFPSAAENIKPKGWLAVINNNLNGTWLMTQTMANRFFIPKQQGIITTIIVNIYRGFPGMAHTGAARAGIANFTKTLAVEWSKYNIRLNCVAPGIIKSTGLENYPPEFLKGIEDTIPFKRLGTTQEVADAAIFLSSPMATYTTGTTLYVDGAQHLWGDMFEL